MRVKSSQLIKSCCTRTNPAAETKSIGLQADASASWRIMVFAAQPRQLYHDMTNPAYLLGHSHLDNIIVTRKSCTLTGPDSYRDLQKHMPTRTLRCAQGRLRRQLPIPPGLGIIEYLDILRFVMRKSHFLLAMLIASMLSLSGCKKEAPLNIILYDKPLTTIKSYIHGKWNLVYGKGGFCGTCVFPCNNCTVEFTTDDRFISKSFVVTTDTTKITWIKDVGMYLQGDSTYLMTFYAYQYFREAYVIDKIYFDTLIYHDNASYPMFYYCVKSK